MPVDDFDRDPVIYDVSQPENGLEYEKISKIADFDPNIVTLFRVSLIQKPDWKAK